MRIDYKEEKVLAFSLIWLAEIVFFGWAAGFTGLIVWGGLLGGLLTTIVFCKVFRWDVWDWLDVTLLLSFGLGVIYYSFFGNWISILLAAIGGVVVFITHRMYRRWGWYKSGKLGLSGLIGLAYWGGMHVAMDWLGISMIIGAIVLLISVVAMGLRSRVS